MLLVATLETLSIAELGVTEVVPLFYTGPRARVFSSLALSLYNIYILITSRSLFIVELFYTNKNPAHSASHVAMYVATEHSVPPIVKNGEMWNMI